MIGAIPFTHGGQRLFSFSKHGTDLSKLKEFAEVLQQEFTIANIPFCELRNREDIQVEPPPVDGYGLNTKVIITFKVDGVRYGFPFYAPRRDILTPVVIRKRSRDVVKDAYLERFAEIYPADDVTVETGWRCT